MKNYRLLRSKSRIALGSIVNAVREKCKTSSSSYAPCAGSNISQFSGSVSKTWNSINPATLSGAIDVIVVEQEDGSLACSPFHVRFGKFSLLRPYEKKVEFKVNNVKQDYAMKLGEGGEAFFVFETSENIPEALQTSPLVSPASSPATLRPGDSDSTTLQEPDFLDLDSSGRPRALSRPQRESLSVNSSPRRTGGNLGKT